MNEFSTIRMELGINAKRLIAESQIYEEGFKKSVETGINMAIDELLSQEGGFEKVVCDIFKKTLFEEIENISREWEVKNKIRTSITNALGEKLNSVSKEWADKLISTLDQ